MSTNHFDKEQHKNEHELWKSKKRVVPSSPEIDEEEPEITPEGPLLDTLPTHCVIGTDESGLQNMNNCFNIKLYDFVDIIEVKESSKYLSILNVNIRCLNTNFQLLLAFLKTVKIPISVIILTETHADATSIQLYNLNDYRKTFINRDSYGGGLVAYLHNSLEFSVVPRFTGITDTHETLFLNLKCPGIKPVSIQILCAYVPHRQFLRAFTQFLESMPKNIFRKKLIIAGDVNVCELRDRSLPSYREFEIFLISKNFSQLIKFPTFLSYNLNPSILDHLWSNMDIPSQTFVFKAPIADHIPSITLFEIETKRPLIKQRFRDLSQRKKDNFNDKLPYLSMELNTKLGPIEDLNIRSHTISSWLITTCNQNFPIQQRMVSQKRMDTPWLTTSLVHFINKKHRLFSLLKEREITHDVYSEYCKKLKLLLKICENSYHKNCFNSTKYDSRKKWKHINKLMGRDSDADYDIDCIEINGEDCENPDIIADTIVDYFTEIPPLLLSKIIPTNVDFSEYVECNPNSMYFSPIEPDEVLNVINELKSNSNLSDIPTSFLRICGKHLAAPLANLFNECVDRAVYPESFKISTVLPKLKSGDKKSIINRRPISIQPPVNKIFEKLIYNRLYSFFHVNKLISFNQFGFLKN